MLKRARAGFSIIELMIALVVVGVLLTLGMPQWTTFLQNTKIKNAAEMTLTGLNLARVEAMRRNSSVRFSLVNNLTSGCAPAANSLSWVVSASDPTGACDAAPSDTTAPRIVQTRSGAEGTAGVQIATTGGAVVTFNGLGRATAGSITQIDLSSGSGVCEHVDPANGTVRCLRVLISAGGQAKLCDPKVGDNSDPRFCI